MWTDLVLWLSDPSGLSPHGYCLLWNPALIWTYAVSDVGIGIAYFTIPLALAVFIHRRRDLAFRPIFWLFAAFILLCGTTHWLDVLTLWVPAYGLEALVKALTGIVSLVTSIVLWWQMPEALALPSPSQLREAHNALHESQNRLHQAQKMQAVGQLTGGIAHDFNNMLQVIRGGLNLMERRIVQGRIEDVARYAASTQQALERAATLTGRLLAFSRMQTLQLRAVKPNLLVRNMEELIRRTLGPAVKLELRLRDDVWKVRSDPNQLETVLLNLTINARDAMPEGGTLVIETIDRHVLAGDLAGPDEGEAGDYVEIAVMDTGTGMTSEVLARIFEPFFTTKPDGQGTGLGLSQVHGFIRQSGGFVRVASQPGNGTAVRLFLPRNAQTSGELPEVDAIASGTIASTAQPMGTTIAVVEDEPGIRAQIVDVLSDMGCNVLEAGDGPAGVRLATSSEPIHLLITDVGLPGLNGREVADAARAARPRLPVLFITGYAGSALAGPGGNPDMEILYKPFTVDRLVAKVTAMLKETLTH